jgi:hypothetical protein
MTLTPAEIEFLAVLAHEMTTLPFGGPATKATLKLGIRSSQLTGLLKRYVDQQNDRNVHPGHPATIDTKIPWSTPEEVLHREEEARSCYRQGLP